ncbi:YCII-related domain protein [Planctomycetes bacterium Pan216]|uniref:YCII-related domain protein n=1 Tax=Kolteria novifilia TaxID=2527975 RepID=A0A518B3S0_9BACT|nr:YCII-related domain protein [Planctomycetes bacterium Pan216]
MKYMLLIYGAEDAWTEEERRDCMEESTRLCHEMNEKKKFLGASPLYPVTTATSVRVREGKRLVTDGPFAETSEQLGGYYLLDVEHLDEAIAYASRIPGAKKGTVEIRPIIELDNLPEVAKT